MPENNTPTFTLHTRTDSSDWALCQSLAGSERIFARRLGDDELIALVMQLWPTYGAISS